MLKIGNKLKRGFTLAEILIALAIVGVVAAMTIPTLTQNARNQANASKLSSVVSDLENAFSAMIVQEDIEDLSELGAGSFVLLDNYYKLAGTGSSLTDYYSSNSPFTTLSGGSGYVFAVKDVDSDEIMMLKNSPVPVVPKIMREALKKIEGNFSCLAKNGAIILFKHDEKDYSFNNAVSGSLGDVIIDVNGADAPNKYGRDVFLFKLGNDGMLYPIGSEKASMLDNNNTNDVWSSASATHACTGNSMTEGCTARLIENRYRIDF